MSDINEPPVHEDGVELRNLAFCPNPVLQQVASLGDESDQEASSSTTVLSGYLWKSNRHLSLLWRAAKPFHQRYFVLSRDAETGEATKLSYYNSDFEMEREKGRFILSVNRSKSDWDQDRTTRARVLY